MDTRKDIEKFAQELLNLPSSESVQVRHLPHLGSWTLQADYSAKSSVGNTTEWGTPRYAGIDLIEAALNLRTPTVYDVDPRTDQRIINPSATEAAREKQQQIKERFPNGFGRMTSAASAWSPNTMRSSTTSESELLTGTTSPCLGPVHHFPATSPKSSRLAHPPNTQHAVGPCCRRRKDLHHGGRRHGGKTAGTMPETLFAVPNHMLGQFPPNFSPFTLAQTSSWPERKTSRRRAAPSSFKNCDRQMGCGHCHPLRL